MKGYDNIPINSSMLLDLPFYEGVGATTSDQAKPHHMVTLVNAPTWDSVASGLGVLSFDGVSDQYLSLLAASSADLNFTTGSYSIGVWFNWTSSISEIIIGRYGTNLDGWEVFLYDGAVADSLTLRHNHASLTPNTNSSCYSADWTQGVWWFLGISRTSGDVFPQHYRNGEPVAMSFESTGMLDPDTCNRNLVMGTRYTLDTNWFKGSMWRPRVWGRALTGDEWVAIFEAERDFFGV